MHIKVEYICIMMKRVVKMHYGGNFKKETNEKKYNHLLEIIVLAGLNLRFKKCFPFHSVRPLHLWVCGII